MSRSISMSARSRLRASRRQTLPLAAAVLSALCSTLFIIALARDRSTPVSSIHTSTRPNAASFLFTTTRSAGYTANFCDGAAPTNFLRSSNRLWLLFLLPAIVFTFVGLALVTDDYFVDALERICECLDLSADVAGATFMAAGSSAPELFTSILSVFSTGDDVGIGTIVGSAVFNILIIIGLSAVLAKETLKLDFRPLLRDSFFYVVSVIALLVIVLFSTRGRADWWEGLILVCAYVVYILFMKFGNKTYFKGTERWVSDPAAESPPMNSEETMENGTSGLEISAVSGSTSGDNTEYTVETGSTEYYVGDMKQDKDYPTLTQKNENEYEGTTFLGVELPTSTLGWVTLPLLFPWQFLFRWTIVPCDTEKTKRLWPLTFSLSILWIMAVSYAMVESARVAGCLIGIPSSVMGLTVLAAGTSVPDALASVAVAKNGFGDMAVSNAIGSNVFDILLGLGLPWFIGGLTKKKAQMVTVDPVGLVVIPIAILLGIIILLVAILALTKWQLSKRCGYLLFALYAAFLTYSLLDVYVIQIGGQ